MFLWEIIKYKSYDSKLRLALTFSPYFEITDDTNDYHKGERYNVNVSYRFSSIFEEYIEDVTLDNRENLESEILENLCLHFLGTLGFVNSCTLEQVIFKNQHLRFGQYFKDKFLKLPIMIQNDIVTNYLSMKNTRNSLKAFIDICNKVFFQVIIYKKNNKLLIYINEDEDKKGILFDLLVDIFLNVDVSIEVFWKYHFGIIGEKEVMKLDKVCIY